MTDDQLQEWWPDLGVLVAELRRNNHTAVIDLLIGAVRGGATSSEILGNIGVVLRGHRALRSQLSDPAKRAWDAIMADVNRPYPLSRLVEWFMRMVRP